LFVHIFPIQFRLIYQVTIFEYRLTAFAVRSFHTSPSMPPAVHCTDLSFFTRCRPRCRVRPWMHL